jgi:hypothetical protein
MAISLTKKEFIDRYQARMKLMEVAAEKDIKEKEIRLKIPIVPGQTECIITSADVTIAIWQLVYEEIERAIDLVYNEELD